MIQQATGQATSAESILKNVKIPLKTLITYCQSHPIHKLSLFGSVLRDDFTQESDIDVLVEFTPNAGIGFFELFTMQEELTAILGRQVDLLTPGALSPYFRQQVIDSAKVLYEKR